MPSLGWALIFISAFSPAMEEMPATTATLFPTEETCLAEIDRLERETVTIIGAWQFHRAGDQENNMFCVELNPSRN